MQGDVQNRDLNVGMTDQTHDYEDPPFGKNLRAPDNFSKDKRKKDTKECIDDVEAICIVHTNDALDSARVQMLEVNDYEICLFTNTLVDEKGPSSDPIQIIKGKYNMIRSKPLCD